MTEAEWLTTEDPQAMLEYVQSCLSDRKLRLFACACCRQVWHLLTDERSRRAVKIAEEYADGRVEDRAMVAAKEAAWDAAWDAARAAAKDAARAAAEDAAMAVARAVAWAAAWAAASNAAWDAARAAAMDAALAIQAVLLRCIAGDPFRPLELPWEPCMHCGEAMTSASLGPHVSRACPWLTPTVLSLAQAAYEERRPDGTLDPFRLALVADALEEAGCPEVVRWQDPKGGPLPDFCGPNPLLEHLHSPGPHVRGCFALDLILGKE